MADIRKHQKYNQAFIRVINAIIEKGLAKNKRQIAIRLGVGHQRLYFPMQGRHRPSTMLIDALVQVFDVNPACFFIEGSELFKNPYKVSKQLGDGIEKALEVTELRNRVSKLEENESKLKEWLVNEGDKRGMEANNNSQSEAHGMSLVEMFIENDYKPLG